MKGIIKVGIPLIVLVGLMLMYMFLSLAPGVSAITAPSLGAAGSFAALAGTTVTSTGLTELHGNLGVSPGSALVGFPPGSVSGTKHTNDGVAKNAQSAITSAYNVLAGEKCGKKVAPDLTGLSLTSGVYCSDSGAFLFHGHLTLNGPGVYIFQMESTLVTNGHGVSVDLTGGASACNVFWQVGSSATLGADPTQFVGNILALTSISMTKGTHVDGGLYARNGAVTLDDNVVGNTGCQSGSTPTPTPRPKKSPTPTSTPGVPTPTPTICPPKCPGMPNTGSDPNA